MDLYEKLRKVEALIERGASQGERQAAELAKQRLLERIQDRVITYRVRCRSAWEKRLFIAVCKKYEYQPFRHHRQKYTTANVTVSEAVMEGILWPEYQKFAKLLRTMIDDITTDLIDKIHHDDSEETVIVGELAASS